MAHIDPTSATFEFITKNLSDKHRAALQILASKGYEPIYFTTRGSTRLLGRNDAYMMMQELGYTYNRSMGLWVVPGSLLDKILSNRRG